MSNAPHIETPAELVANLRRDYIVVIDPQTPCVAPIRLTVKAATPGGAERRAAKWFGTTDNHIARLMLPSGRSRAAVYSVRYIVTEA